MTFVSFIAFIVVVVVMQTAFARIRSSTSDQEQANADFIEGIEVHFESILSKLPKPVASSEAKEAKIETLKLANAKANAKGLSLEGFFSSGFAHNTTRISKGCSSKKDPSDIQFIVGLALGDCQSNGNSSTALSCNANKDRFEYSTNFWFGSQDCKSLIDPPDASYSDGVGKTCNKDMQKFGVSSGCGENNKYLQPATVITKKESSVMTAFYYSIDACMNNTQPYMLHAMPLNGCLVLTGRKGEAKGSLSYTDCKVDMSGLGIKTRMYKSANCKGKYQVVNSPPQSTECNIGKGNPLSSRRWCNKPRNP